jgi:hypothetical protein
MQGIETFWDELYFYISKNMVSMSLYVSVKQESKNLPLTCSLLPPTPPLLAAAFQNIGFLNIF